MGITASPPVTRPGLPRADAVLLRLELIGRMQALTLDNRSVLPLGRKTRALLAILALSNRRPVLRQRLAELLWSRRSEEQARASLRQEIHRLLDALSPLGAEVVAVDRHMLALKPGLTSVDAERILNAQPGYAGSLPSLDGVLLEELNGTDPAFDLWLAGERSPYVRPEHAEPMKRLFPRTTSVTIKGAGHWVHSEKPEAFVSALRTFLLAGR